MKKHEVVLGQVYAVKVSGSLQPVRLVAESASGGWVGRNERTGREIRIRSAAKLRVRLEKSGDRWQLARTQAPNGDRHEQNQKDRGVSY